MDSSTAMVKGDASTVCNLFKQCVSQAPDQIAILAKESSLTYKELDSASTKLAAICLRLGVKAGDRVPVLTTRCLETVTCFLAVLKAGACYVPIDLDSWSSDRIQTTLATISTSVLITTGSENYPEYTVIPYRLVLEAHRNQEKVDERILPPVRHSDTAYIIFTSGTTSAPKGVVIPHSALANYVQQPPFNLNATASDTVLLLFSVAFDACTGVIFSTICNGGRLLLSDTSNFMSDAKLCSILPATPSILQTIQNAELYANIKGIFLGGEHPNPSLVKAWHSPNRRLYNCYGPTETTCTSLIGELIPEMPIVLGSPMPNSSIILLDSEMKVSDEGEICISGPGLAIGYFANPVLTEKSFFVRDNIRHYRTGDIAKNTAYGLQYVGRRDALVKNRGFLINLDLQVTPALLENSKVESASSMMHNGRLIGFVTPAHLDPQDLRSKLIARFDAFVVPDKIYPLQTLPLTSNGKINNKALKEQLQKRVAAPDLESESKTDQPLLSLLRKAISLALKVPLNEIDSKASFWDLGGNSLAAISLLSHLHTESITIPVARIFSSKSLDEMCLGLSPTGFTPEDHLGIQQDSSLANLSPTTPMTTVQLKMVRGSIIRPLLNYMLLSIKFPHQSQFLGTVDLRSAWQKLMERHSIFATCYDMESEKQLVRSTIDLNWKEVSANAGELDAVLREQVDQIYKLVQSDDGWNAKQANIDPPTVFRLINSPENSHLLWMVHHSRIDGWSMGVIIEELQAIMDGKKLQPAPQFIEVASMQSQIKRRDEQHAQTFWSNALENHLPPKPLLLPIVHPNTSPSMAIEISEQIRCLDISSAQLQSKSRLLRISPAALIYSAWGLLLSKYCATTRPTFGVVFSGRNVPIQNATHVIGPLINTCPFPVHADGTTDLREMMKSVQNLISEMSDLQWSASDAVAGASKGAQSGLFQTIVALQYDLPDYRWDCQSYLGPWEIDRKEISEFGLTVLVESENDELMVRILFDPSQFASPVMARMATHFKNLFSICCEPDFVSVDDALSRMFDHGELAELTNHSSTMDKPYKGARTVKEAFESIANELPDLKAVEYNQTSMTYRELEKAANRIANHLTSLVGPGDTVAIISDGSLLWILSIISILKTGAAYCPIDISLPMQRAHTIIAESKVSLCLVPNKDCQRTMDLSSVVLVLVTEELFLADTHHAQACAPFVQATPDDTVVIVFTSGSTGVPKGVQANHRGILSYISFPPARLHAAPGRRNAQLFSVGFDACMAEIFGTLCYGATFVLKDSDHPYSHLSRVNATMATPSFLSSLQAPDFENLDTILLGGEAIPQSLANTWSEGRRLYNGYGPCECTVGSVFAHLTPGKAVTLGRPIPRMTVYLLDDSQLPVPIGIPGEIYLSGAQVTRGYSNLEAKTRECFLPDPFRHNQTMYRTGDIGRWTESMELEFIGRVDSLVKVRGYRVDLGDIEHHIRTMESEVTNAVVVVREDTLIGYITPRNILVDRLYTQLCSALPSYYRPSQVIALDEFPMSVNQKVDRKALQERPIVRVKHGEAPSTKTECILADIWQEIIGIQNCPQINRDDDFMELGGHSLLQIKTGRLIADALGCAVPLGVIIRNPKLSDLAKAIDEFVKKQEGNDLKTIPFLQTPRLQRKGDLAISYLEEDMLLYSLITDTPSIFNMACHIEFRGNLDVTAFEKAINSVLSDTEIFNSRYKNADGMLLRHIEPASIQVYRIPPKEWNQETIHAAINLPFSLTTGPGIRAMLLEKDHQVNYLVLVVHHILADKAALNAILESIAAAYSRILGPMHGFSESTNIEGQTRNTGSSLGPTYVDWAEWTNARPQSKETLAFWQQNFRNIPDLPFSRHARSQGLFLYGRDSGLSNTYSIPKMLHQSMLQFCRENSINPQHLILTGVALTVSVLTKQNDLYLAVPYMDRYESGTSDLIGLMLDRQPIRFDLSTPSMDSVKSLLSQTETSTQDTRANYIPFTELRKISRTASIFDVMVTYHEQSDVLENFQLPGCTTTFHRAKAEGAKFPLMFEFVQDSYEIEYNTHLFTSQQVADISSVLQSIFRSLCQQAESPSEILHRLSLSFNYDPPSRDLLQERTDVIREAFAETLGLERKDISCMRSFFELGGTSALALRLCHFLRKRGFEISLRQILVMQTAQALAVAWV